MAEKTGLWHWTKRMFLKGLATLLPTILTIYVFLVVFSFVRDRVSEPINVLVGKQVYTTEWGRKYLYERFDVPPQGEDNKPLGTEELETELRTKLPWWPGFIIAFLAVMAVGFFIASFLGRRIWRGGERLIMRVPVIKVVYPYAKQVTDFVFGDKKMPVYSSVVAVQFTRPGVWNVGFVTGEGLHDIKECVGKKMLTIFVPCSPAPMSGFTIMLPSDEVVPINMTVDDAMRFIISAGVITPQQQLTKEGQTRLLQLKESGRLKQIKSAENQPEK